MAEPPVVAPEAAGVMAGGEQLLRHAGELRSIVRP